MMNLSDQRFAPLQGDTRCERKTNHPSIREYLAGFLEDYDLSQHHLAAATPASPQRINEIVRGGCRIVANTVLRLICFFGAGAQYWLSLQDRYTFRRKPGFRS